MAILGLGFAVSASAVVPGFDQLIHHNKIYLAITSLLGLAAFAGGLQMMFSASGAGLTMMMAAMVTLWSIATAHHLLILSSRLLRLRWFQPPPESVSRAVHDLPQPSRRNRPGLRRRGSTLRRRWQRAPQAHCGRASSSTVRLPRPPR